jgi:hypothetical protein
MPGWQEKAAGYPDANCPSLVFRKEITELITRQNKGSIAIINSSKALVGHSHGFSCNLLAYLNKKIFDDQYHV